MSAFGGVNNGSSPQPAANPWDLGGLDPVPLMATNGSQQVRRKLFDHYSMFML